MIYKFKSKAAGDLIMLAPHGDQILRILGKEPSAQGIFDVADMPAAIAAKIAAPERTVVCLAGDGDFLMTGQELATAVQNQAAPIILLFNNGMYGTIRMHQEREFPARVHGTQLANPHFALLAQAYGGLGVVVERTDEFGPALMQAVEHTRGKRTPALIELRCDPEVITPNATLSAIRATAQLQRP
jgi:acetolactate synthase-1/2/3 large subunit